MPTLYTVAIDTELEWDWDTGRPATDLRVTNIRQHYEHVTSGLSFKPMRPEGTIVGLAYESRLKEIEKERAKEELVATR